MTATVQVNQLTVVHKKSGGQSTAFPDPCLTPPVPTAVPYTNTAYSKDAANTATTVFADGEPIMIKRSYFSTSIGDEEGTAGGVISGTYQGKASFVNYSFDVKAEGENVPRLYDPMAQNHGSPPNTFGPAEQQANIAADEIEIICAAICACHAAGQKTKCVEAILATPRVANGKHLYWDPHDPRIYVEVPFNMGTSPPSPLLSTSQRRSTPPYHPLPKAEWPPIAGTRRPDIVLAKDPSKPLTQDNIKRIVEIKFPPDPWRKGQREAYDSMDPTGQALELNPEECRCQAGEPEPVTQPAPQEEEEPQFHVNWDAVGKGALIVAGVAAFAAVVYFTGGLALAPLAL